MEDSQVKKTIACVVLCVLALSLVSLAADRRSVTAKSRGGKPNNDAIPLFNTIYKNLASTKNLYWCCNGNIIAGSGNIYGFAPYQEALQFTTTTNHHVHSFKTEVAYDIQGSASTFNISIQTDAGGVPSGTVVVGPVEMTVDSQPFGGCCSAVTASVTTTRLPAGTYWVVWAADSGSDLVAEVNVENKDEVDLTNNAFFDGTQWNAYQSTQGFNIGIN
jgi:hypothetical protein